MGLWGAHGQEDIALPLKRQCNKQQTAQRDTAQKQQHEGCWRHTGGRVIYSPPSYCGGTEIVREFF